MRLAALLLFICAETACQQERVLEAVASINPSDGTAAQEPPSEIFAMPTVAGEDGRIYFLSPLSPVPPPEGVTNDPGTDDGLAWRDVTFAYAPGSATWTRLADRPHLYYEFAALSYRGTIYDLDRRRMYAYDARADRWIERSVPSEALLNSNASDGHRACVNADGKLYWYSSDVNGVGRYLGTYDDVADQWSPQPLVDKDGRSALPKCITDHETLPDFSGIDSHAACELLADRWYCFGGYASGAGTAAIDTGFVFDPQSQAWTPAPSMPVATTDAASAVMDDRLYLFGGFAHEPTDASEALRLVQVFNPRTGTWRTSP
jgi:hypothetical protein